MLFVFIPAAACLSYFSQTGTFDMTLLLVTIAWLGVNIGLTLWVKPSLFDHAEFWLLQVRVWVCFLSESGFVVNLLSSSKYRFSRRTL